MAVVLPIQSQFDFSNPMDNDYGSRCQSEEKEDESSSVMFSNRQSESSNAETDGNAPCLSDEAEEQLDGFNNSMDIGDNSDGCGEKPETLPLNMLAEQCETERLDDSTTANDCNPKKEDVQTSKTSADNYWMMENEEKNHESTIPEEDNNAFISSLIAVDLASTNPETNANPIEEPVSNVVEALLMDESVEKNEDEMEVDGTPTVEAFLMTESNDQYQDGDAKNVDFDFSTTPIVAEAISEAETCEAPSYGGLNNLGNTCYMASAIQLLCGLDSFPADLKSRIPPENHDNDDKESLRDALLDVIDRLGNGETVRPDHLKRCIDSRTSLFLGYRQQDSHEFLTTLLDIIDEDYKIKPKPEEPAAAATTTTTESPDRVNNHEENDLASDEENEEPPTSDENEIIEQECNEDENDRDCDCESIDDSSDRMPLETPLKKQKVIDNEPPMESEDQSFAPEQIERVEETTDAESMRKSKSYSDFKFSDIESLLHDKGESSVEGAIDSVVETKSTLRQEEPKCKLAGGRMSTAGVELTRFVDESGLDEDVRPTGVSLENATPQQQIVDGDEHETEEGIEETCLSPVSSNFTTKVRVCLTCESCKFRRSHIETYLHLSLDISTGSNESVDSDDEVCSLGCPSSSSIEEGLRRFFAPEKRDIKCEKCFHTTALQTSEITQLPRNLLFHLKRFIVDVSPDYSSISYRKDQSSVVFDERMELEASENEHTTETYRLHDDEECGIRDFLAQDCVLEEGACYELRSVVNHIGSSASCGHYTADAKRLAKAEIKDVETSTADGEEPMAGDREWIRFNDSYVSNITSREAVQDASKTAYMIMYELV